MSKFIFLNILFIINYLLASQKLCGRYEVEHCSLCDNDLDKCNKCDDKYFPLFAGLRCIRCNDNYYGQPECEGNCDGSRYSEIGMPLSDKCKEGFYSMQGICFNCTSELEKCIKCSYENSPGK